MANSMTLPTIGILALVGAGLGVHLGNASVAEIDPHYFSEPPARFHADLSPNRSTSADGYAPRAELAAAQELGTGCIGCGAFPEEYRPVQDPAVEDYVAERPNSEAAVQLAAYVEEPVAEIERRQAGIERVQRYTSFAVSSEQAVSYASAGEGAEIEPSGGLAE